MVGGEEEEKGGKGAEEKELIPYENKIGSKWGLTPPYLLRWKCW